MAGHSKWAQIKRQKSAADAKRGVAFSKLANAISIAARDGADPETNFRLRIAIEQAKRFNMPKENIQRAINKATGASGETKLEEIIFEAYGPGGIAFIIEVVTDNRNRIVAEIRSVLNKYNAKLAGSGAVDYLFKKRGVIVIESTHPEAVELAAIEAGAQDFKTEDNRIFIYTKPQLLETVRRDLVQRGFESSEIFLEFYPTSTMRINNPAVAKKVIELYEVLDELNDVVSVSTNFEISDD